MTELAECNITVVGFGSSGAAAIEMLGNSSLSGVRYELIDAPVVDAELGAFTLPQYIARRFSKVDLLFLLIENLSSAETRIAVEIASMGNDSPYFLMAVAPNLSDIDSFKRAHATNCRSKVGAFLCLQSSAEGDQSIHENNVSGECLCSAVRGITNLLANTGFVCFDLADLRCALSLPGVVQLGFGSANGNNKEYEALQRAIHSMPDGLAKLRSARGVVGCIQGGNDFGLKQFSMIGDLIDDHVSEDCTSAVGTCVDLCQEDKITTYLYVLS